MKTAAPEDGAFLKLLNRLEYGRLLDDLDDHQVNLIRELAKAEERGQSPRGTITLKVNFDFTEGTLDVTADVAVTKPRLKRARTVLFANKQGDVVGAAPRQEDLFDDVGEAADVVSPVSASAPAVSTATAPAAPTTVATPAASAPAPIDELPPVVVPTADAARAEPQEYLRAVK